MSHVPTTDPPTPDRSVVEQALSQVVDPEVGLAITDLGLVRRIELASGRCDVTLTMTSASCPLGGLIVDEATQALRDALGCEVACQVQIELDPPWTPEAMSASARARFGV